LKAIPPAVRRNPYTSGPTMVPSVPPIRPILIKQYAGRRLYHPAAGSYLTLDDVAAMVEDGKEFAVIEAESGTDITSSIRQHITRKRALHG
jgi:polyhydroxyalkanoate synthesis regulator protein